MTSKHWYETGFHHWARENARIARNAKLAALVTAETAGLLERLAKYADTWGDWDTCNDDTDAAHELAASIREALALETNDA